MGEYLEEKFNADIELVESGGGVFEITVDGALAFSKRKEGRFPSEEELMGLSA